MITNFNVNRYIERIAERRKFFIGCYCYIAVNIITEFERSKSYVFSAYSIAEIPGVRNKKEERRGAPLPFNLF